LFTLSSKPDFHWISHLRTNCHDSTRNPVHAIFTQKIMLTFSRNEPQVQTLGDEKTMLIILAFILLGCACSTASLVYRNADWYLRHKINGYASFNEKQKTAIRREIFDYMQWHRKVALPEYIIFLQNLNGAVQYNGQLSVAGIDQLRMQLLGLYKKTLVPAIAPATEIFASMDSSQILELARNLAGENRQHRHEEADSDPDKYLDRRADKTISFVEWLAGDLSRKQERQIREMSRRLPMVGEIYMRQRETNQGRLIGLLQEHAGKEQVGAFLSSWTLTPEAGRTPAQQHAIESFDLAADEMIVDIHGLLTDKQKDHIHKMVSSYIDDMRAAHDASLQETGT